MTYTETRYFAARECPTKPGYLDMARITFQSSAPFTLLSPTTRPEDVEWHLCEPTSSGGAR